MKNAKLSTKGHLQATNNVQRISNTLTINKGALDTYIDLEVSDKNGKVEQRISKKGDSLVANFLRALWSQMCPTTRDNIMGTMYPRVKLLIGTDISSITSGTDGRIKLTFSGAQFSSAVYDSGGKIALGGFQGVTLDGVYDFVKIDSYRLELIGTTYSAGWTTGTGTMHIFLAKTYLYNPSEDGLNDDGIYIGSGTTAVTINDFTLEKPIPSSSNGGLTYNTSTVSQDTNDATTSQITFTRTFTNNSSSSVAVNEIGYFINVGSMNYKLMIMRDILPSAVNVAVGKTLTINYRIKTQLNTTGDTGGFVSNFVKLLYRHLAKQDRAAIDINNVSRTLYVSSRTLLAVKCGGYSVEYPGSNREEVEGYKYGVILGKGNTPVSMGDYYMETPILHGSATDELLYYGGFAQDFTIGADYAEFSIKKAMENISGDTITIKEFGLTGASGTGVDYNSSYATYVYLLTRNILETPIALENNKVLIAEYKIRVQV